MFAGPYRLMILKIIIRKEKGVEVTGAPALEVEEVVVVNGEGWVFG